MLKKQIDLTDRPPQEKISFLRLLHERSGYLDYVGFAKLDCNKSMQEEKDEEIDLETFIANIDENTGVRVMVGSPDPALIYGAFFYVRLPKSPEVERLANFNVAYTPPNYCMMDQLLKDSFGKGIDSL